MPRPFSQVELENLQQQFFFQLGYKVDLYHSEEHRGIIIVPHGRPLHPANIVKAFNY
jgi:hypothetical protein